MIIGKRLKKYSFKPIGRVIYTLLTNPEYTDRVVNFLLLLEFIFGCLIIWKVNYTEIDWIAYMQEVNGVINGEYDYSKLKGDTGPLVYPGGFVYIYIILYHLTSKGSNIKLGQFLFLGLYLLVFKVVSYIHKELSLPPGILLLLCLSKRIHSIFMLRLFNDPFAMLFAYLGIYQMLKNNFIKATFWISAGLSVKMNVLLFFPGYFLILFITKGPIKLLFHILLIIIFQALVGLPFILTNWKTYLEGAFNFSRQFDFTWTVNWRMIPQPIFNSQSFAMILLGLQLSILSIFLITCWSQPYGGIFYLIKSRILSPLGPVKQHSLESRTLVKIMFTCNFIGILVSRSLHYQFYAWYFHTLPILFYSINYLYPFIFRLALFIGIEYAWNTYPSTVFSSFTLLGCHTALLVGLWADQFRGNLVSRTRNPPVINKKIE